MEPTLGALAGGLAARAGRRVGRTSSSAVSGDMRVACRDTCIYIELYMYIYIYVWAGPTGVAGRGWAGLSATDDDRGDECADAAVRRSDSEWWRAGWHAVIHIYVCTCMSIGRVAGPGLWDRGEGVGGRGAGGDWRNKWFDAGALQCVAGGGGMQ